ncbi:MAG: stage II sporulation protein D [Spirochaetales bacterium]|nr:stage II sporulation protein D [Spirochaetales bacterium]
MKKMFFFTLTLLLIYYIFTRSPAKENLIAHVNNDNIIYLTRAKTQDIVELNFEDYIAGVVYAEMPASFEVEALKAQAVAARTYTIKKLASGTHICDDSTHCQAWKEADESEEYKKVAQAVKSTESEILTYLGEAISAFFHSASGGKTENVKDVWGGEEIPYLLSVDSPNENTLMSTFFSEQEISYADFANKINHYTGKKTVSYDLSQTKNIAKFKKEIKIVSRTEGDHVESINVSGTTFSGTEFRNIFDLRSTNFTITLKDKTILIQVKGYGHGVGMSQWGAQVMAKAGKDYREILYHYYPNTLLEKQAYQKKA